MAALLRKDSSKKGMKLQWDEANLEENEKIKEELNPIPITEPKTPYRRTMEPDSDDDMPMNAESNEEAVLGTSAGSGAVASSSTVAKFWDDLEILQQKRSASSEAECHSDSGHSQAHSEGAHPEAHPEWDPEVQGKRRKFCSSRKEHYNMKDMILKAREMLAHEDDDGDQQLGDA